MQTQLTFHTRGGAPENVDNGLVGNRAYIKNGLVLQRVDDETVHIHADMTSGVDAEERQSIVHGICDLIVTVALVDSPVQQRDETRVEVLTQIANHINFRLKVEAAKTSLTGENKKQEDYHE